MRLFVCEFITGGGMQDADLPPALTREGEMMLSALVSDLQDAGYREIVTTRDSRLDNVRQDIEIINPGKNVWQTWQQCMQDCDAVWLIAPESSGVMYELTAMAEESNSLLIGSSSTAVKLATSKSKTIEHLLNHRIPVVPVLQDLDHLSLRADGWVIKPDDGAGAEGCYRFDNPVSLHNHIGCLDDRNFIVQEYVPGIPASISMVCLQGEAGVLACNEQLFAFENGKGHLSGVVVNGLQQYRQVFEKIAGDIAGAIDGLAGYAGIDLVMTEQGPLVVEINPRLTTAYTGLARSLGKNPSEMVMTLLQNRRFPDLHGVKYRPVTVRF
jgi:predicted ATP-grasp superfamily ATP-dependent carboligase